MRDKTIRRKVNILFHYFLQKTLPSSFVFLKSSHFNNLTVQIRKESKPWKYLDFIIDF